MGGNHGIERAVSMPIHNGSKPGAAHPLRGGGRDGLVTGRHDVSLGRHAERPGRQPRRPGHPGDHQGDAVAQPADGAHLRQAGLGLRPATDVQNNIDVVFVQRAAPPRNQGVAGKRRLAGLATPVHVPAGGMQLRRGVVDGPVLGADHQDLGRNCRRPLSLPLESGHIDLLHGHEV